MNLYMTNSDDFGIRTLPAGTLYSRVCVQKEYLQIMLSGAQWGWKKIEPRCL